MRLLTMFACAFVLTMPVFGDEPAPALAEPAPAAVSEAATPAPVVAGSNDAKAESVVAEPPRVPGRNPEPMLVPECNAACRRSLRWRRALAYVVLEVARGFAK